MVWGIVIWVVLTVISMILSANQKTPHTKITPGEVGGTVVDSSSNVPVLFGTRLIDTPNLVWYGDTDTSKVETCGGKK